MPYYNPLHVHSSDSLLDGCSQIKHIPKRIHEIGAQACAITEHGNINSSISFIKECKEYKDAEIKPIVGIELYLCEHSSSQRDSENRELSHLLVYAKNNDGWKSLLKIIEWSNRPEHFYYRPRISLSELAQFSEGLACVNGHLGSPLSKVILSGNLNNALRMIGQYKDIFGDDFWIECQPICNKFSSDGRKVLNGARQLIEKTGVKGLATPDAHYLRREDRILQNIMLCKTLNITLDQGSECGMSTFFEHDDFHIPTYEEMLDYGSKPEELEHTIEFTNRIEEYTNILHEPMLPQFGCPEGYNPDTWLRQLCREGWKKKIKDKIVKQKESIYAERVKEELAVLQDANLSSYFLILHDIMQFVDKMGWLRGVGRGSSGSSMVSYLLDITKVDPIKHDLLFSRFYNSARKGSLPDIDFDVPKHAREYVLDYIKNKYGHDRVGLIATFGTMQGRNALKDVLRAYGIDFEEANTITKNLPEPAKIAAELEQIKKEGGDPSIIKYALKQDPEKFREWAYYDEDDVLQGPYAVQFENAIRLEGIKVSVGKHPAGIIITPSSLSNICPMIYDSKTKTQICGFDLEDAESVGAMKLDCLGLSALDKLMDIKNILRTGVVQKITMKEGENNEIR